MKKLFIGLAVFLLLLSVSPAWALDVKVEGTTVGGSFASSVNFTGAVSGSGNFSEKTIRIGGAIEVLTSETETVVAADNGTIFITPTDGCTFTLPAAAAGLTFTFVEGSTTATATVNTTGSDAFVNFGEVSGPTGTLTSTAGDVADSVTIAGSSSGWYVIDMGAAAWTTTEES